MIRVLIYAFVLMLSTLAHANSVDRGYFDDSKFQYSYAFQNVRVLSNGQVSAQSIEKLFNEELELIRPFLVRHGYHPGLLTSQSITIKIISMSDINDPKYFTDGDEHCKQGVYSDTKLCDSFFMGRTFYIEGSTYSDIRIYLGFARGSAYVGEFSFANSVRHELFHALTAKLGVKSEIGSDDKEHELLKSFFKYIANQEKGIAKKVSIR